ncbi:MAG: class II fructose-bisphosphate aldolase [Oscillospiraceae bacterium]|nr:class II fructose-bisphosphate aldolase [Oscillospiraceae bacterium]
MLVTLQKIIQMAEEGNYCIPAFNVYNIETVMGIMEAAEERKAPVILQLYPRLVNQEVGFYIAPAVVAAAQRASVPVCLHLDHAAGKEEVYKSLRWGFTGIMQDGSALPYEENVALTRSAVEMCNTIGVGVEGELGHVGSVNDASMGDFTDPQEAAEFVKDTGVCCLAVLVGNAHGHYKKVPNLDIDRIRSIRQACGVPLVLHGGSGIPDEQVKAAIAAGIRKMNIGTDVCCAFAEGTKRTMDDPNRHLAVDVFMKEAIRTVKELALDKIELTGAAGKAV